MEIYIYYAHIHTHTRTQRERERHIQSYVSLINLIPRYARGENNYELAQYASSGGGGGGGDGTGHRNSRG